MGENISQTAQFVQSGNADVGFVALSLLYTPALRNVGHYVQVDPKLYPLLQQALALTKTGAGNPAAKDYFHFLTSSDARAIFDRYGFELPPLAVIVLDDVVAVEPIAVLIEIVL